MSNDKSMQANVEISIGKILTAIVENVELKLDGIDKLKPGDAFTLCEVLFDKVMDELQREYKNICAEHKAKLLARFAHHTGIRELVDDDVAKVMSDIEDNNKTISELMKLLDSLKEHVNSKDKEVH